MSYANFKTILTKKHLLKNELSKTQFNKNGAPIEDGPFSKLQPKLLSWHNRPFFGGTPICSFLPLQTTKILKCFGVYHTSGFQIKSLQINFQSFAFLIYIYFFQSEGVELEWLIEICYL